MSKQYSLAYLTVNGCSPPEMTYIAARAGYDFISLRLIPMGVAGETPYLPNDKAMISKTKAALKETGIKVLDLELARIVEEVDPQSYVPAMEVIAELGAKHVISSAWTTRRDDRNLIVDSYAEICDLAKPFGLTVNLEFPTFSRLTNLQEAADIVRAADRSNGGVLIDTLYFHYSKVDADELLTLPGEWFNFLHICDVSNEIPDSKEGMIKVARDERLYIGEGCIDIPSVIKRLPHIPFSIELPNAVRIKQYGHEEHARRCLEAAKHHLDHIEARRDSVCQDHPLKLVE